LNSVNGSEIIGRYIYSKQHYKTSNYTVRHGAFMPPPDGRLSVFIISGLNENDIWSIGESLRDSNLKARADITADSVHKSHLDIQVDNHPERHAEIVNWPEEHSAILLKAMELAKNAILRLKS